MSALFYCDYCDYPVVLLTLYSRFYYSFLLWGSIHWYYINSTLFQLYSIEILQPYYQNYTIGTPIMFYQMALLNHSFILVILVHSIIQVYVCESI